MNNHWKFCPLRGFSFTTVLQGSHKKRLFCYSCPLPGSAYICKKKVIYTSGVRIYFCQLIVEDSHETIDAGWVREGSVTGVGIMGIWATSSCTLFVFSRACSGLVMHIPFSFDNGVLLCMPYFMV